MFERESGYTLRLCRRYTDVSNRETALQFAVDWCALNDPHNFHFCGSSTLSIDPHSCARVRAFSGLTHQRNLTRV